MAVKQRIKELRDQIPQLKQVYESGDTADYRLKAENWYGGLRVTWERTVEESVLNGVVKRFSRGVETKKLKQVAGCLTKDDYAAIEAGMSKSSRWLKGHDEPSASNAPIPDPSEIEKDLNNLHAFFRDYESRKSSS